MINAFVGTPTLLAAMMRHDGRRFLPWVVIVTALSASSVLVYPWVFPEQQDRMELAALVGSNPAMGLIFGPAYDLSTSDGFNSWRALALGGFFVALGSIFAVIRATRGQEDSGQAELLASGVMGRGSRLLVGLSVATAGSMLAGLVSGVITVLCGGGWENSFLLAATFSATGLMAAGLSGLTAQLGSDARTASSMAVGIFGTLFLFRGFSYSMDLPNWVNWINPLAWMTETRPASSNNWWPLALALIMTIVLMAAAFIVQARRDFGKGALAPRRGPASGNVRTPLALAIRLNKGPIITWGIAFLVLGVVFGFFSTSITDLLSENSAISNVLAAESGGQETLTGSFLMMIFSLLGIIAAIPGVQSMLKVHSEENEDRVELLLATKLPRTTYFISNIVVAFVPPAFYMMIAGFIIGVIASYADIGVSLAEVFFQSMCTIPALWAVIAVSVAVVGARPRVSLVAWVGVVASFALTLLGPTFKLPDWALGISPFWHVPMVVGQENQSFLGLLCVAVVAALFLLVGISGFKKRDLARQ